MQRTPSTRRLLLATLAASALAFGSAARAQDAVNIGFTGPLSGGAALYGKNVVDGLEMAIKEINAQNPQVGGKAVQYKLVALDDKYSPAEAAVNARRLVQQSKAVIVFVPHSGGIYALQAFNQQGPSPFIVMAYSSVPKITESGNKLSVRIPPRFDVYIEPFSRYEMKRFGKKIGELPADHEYGKAWTQLFTPAWTRLGGEVVAENPMSYTKSADFYSGVSKVLAAKPDAVFAGGPSEATALIVKQARDLGFKGGFLFMDQAKFDEMARVLGGYELLEGSVGVVPQRDDDREGPRAFAAAFAKVFGAERATTSESSYNYAMMHILAGAMKLAGTTSDPKAIYAKIDAAAKALPTKYNSGVFRGLDAQGGMIGDPHAAVIEGGKLKSVDVSTLGK